MTATPCEERGYSVGDRFIVTGDKAEADHRFEVGEIVTLLEDDGTTAPLFVPDDDGDNWYVHLEDVQPLNRPDPKVDVVNHPSHYTAHSSGVECIEVTEHMNFCLGNAMKYIWRADLKHDAIEDLRKAAWYIDREISRRERLSEHSPAESVAN